MYCPECGKENADDGIFCKNCGLNLSKLDTQTSAPVSSSQAMPYREPRSSQPEDVHPMNQQKSSVLEFADEQTGQEVVPWYFYLLSLLFWPIGIYFWAIQRDKNPEAARNLLIVSIMGFLLLVFLLP